MAVDEIETALAKPMTPIDRVRCALAMAEAGYKTEVSLEDAEVLLHAFDKHHQALMLVRSLIAEGAATGFNCHDGDWAERLFASQAQSYDAIRTATRS